MKISTPDRILFLLILKGTYIYIYIQTHDILFSMDGSQNSGMGHLFHVRVNNFLSFQKVKKESKKSKKCQKVKKHEKRVKNIKKGSKKCQNH